MIEIGSRVGVLRLSGSVLLGGEVIGNATDDKGNFIYLIKFSNQRGWFKAEDVFRNIKVREGEEKSFGNL